MTQVKDKSDDSVLQTTEPTISGTSQQSGMNATVERQNKLDANTDALLTKLRQNNPNNYSDDTLLSNWASQQNEKIQRPPDKTNVGPRVTIVGGGDPSARFHERRKNFIENNPYAVSPSERVAYLGSGTQSQSFEGALRQQEDEEKRRRTAGIEQAKNAERTAYSQKQIQDAKRRDALGLAVNVALDGLQKNGVIKEKNGHRYIMYSVMPGTLSTVNDQWRTNGGKSEYNSIVAYAEIDDNNKIIGEPMIATRNVHDGQTGKGKGIFKKWTLTEVETALNRAHQTLYSDKGDANEKTKSVMNDYGVIGKGKSSTGTSGVEIAKINAASREKVAEMNNETKLNLANLSGDQKKELAEADNILKKYGIDVGLQIAREKNETAENIATQREEGRQSRAVMRDDQAWAKLAVEQDKVDKSFSVQMKKADTYEKRVGLIEQKLKNDYEIARKKVKTVEERLQVDAEYKDRMASVAEGNVDLGWFKAETAADQSQQKIDNAKIDAAEKRKLQVELASINARKTRIEKLGGVVKDSDLKRMAEIQKVLSGGNLTPEKRKELKDSLNGKDTIKTSDNSSDDNAESTEYPGYTVGKAKRAIAAGWKWDDKKRVFYKAEGK